MNVNPKHDRQGVRTPSDLERKYNLGDRAEIMEIVANAQRAATNAQAVANEANATAAQANATAAAAQTAVTNLEGNVYTKEQALSSEVKTLLGLSDTATPSDALTALYNLIKGSDA